MTVTLHLWSLSFILLLTSGMIMMIGERLQAEIGTLRGILPICASCKKIRDDKGYWNQIEAYIRDHSDVEFSHGICPDCMKRLYPQYAKHD